MYVILHTYKALPWHVECVTLILVHIPLQSILHEFLSNGLTKVMTWSSRDWHSCNVIVASACGVQVGTWELAVGRDRRIHIWGIFDIVKYWEGHILVSRDHDPQLCLCDLQEAELTLKQSFLHLHSRTWLESGMVPTNDEDTSDESVSYLPVDSRR